MRIVILLITALMMNGCSTVGYYMQAIGGHLDLTSREQPISDLLANDDMKMDIKDKLKLALQAREYASKQLYLPDNDSYKSYADLERPFVVWTVVATQEFSVEPRQWCFMIVGCLTYRGYFDKAGAEKEAAALKQQGLDVSISGTSAYSTLGYFDDPLLNTMLKYGETNMVGVIFHELAHQLIHIDGDTAFNEAFATTIEQEGLRRWFTARAETEKYAAYIKKKSHQRVVFDFLRDTRKELDELYKQKLSEQIKRRQKRQVIEKLKKRYKDWQQATGYHGFDNWMTKDLNNSHLALIATYQDLVPGFLALLKSEKGDIPAFYKRVRSLGEQDRPTRTANLSQTH